MKCSRFYIYIVLACIITSCSKHLSRKEARNQIQPIVGSDFSSDKKCETFRIHERYLKDHEWNGFGKVCLNANKQNYSDYSELLEKLVENKYIEISDDEYYDDCSNLYTHVKVLNTNDLAATDAGYVGEPNDDSYLMRIYNVTFGEVTGIIEKDASKTAEVEYKIKNKQ